MCGHVGQNQLEFEFDEGAVSRNQSKWDRLRKILEKTQTLSPRSHHIPLWKQAVIITQDDIDNPQLAQFAWMTKTKQGRPWPVFNVRVEGGWGNKSNSPDYKGPFGIFKNPYVEHLIMTQRCVIPADFFIEQPDKKQYPKDKRKFLIRREDEQALYLAGIFNELIDPETGEITGRAFTIKTTAYSGITAKALHKRSPLVIPEDTIFDYLNPDATQDDLSAFYFPPSSEGFIAHEVMPEMAKRKLPEGFEVDDPRLITPTGDILKAA